MGNYRSYEPSKRHRPKEENHIDVADLSVSCGVMKDYETDDNEKINRMNIDELELSVHSYNCLKRAGISAVGELRSKSSEDMMKVRWKWDSVSRQKPPRKNLNPGLNSICRKIR